jgi:fatty acid desaturase
MPAGDPKHAVRATRSAGREMRSRLLDGASRLFREHGLSGASISDIAAAADAFPSQITYYFRTKEALFVEAACREMLYVARAAEQAALAAQTPRDYTRSLVASVTATDSVAFFAEALTLTRRRQDLAALVERTIERLHGEGLRAYSNQIERHGWKSLRDPDATSRRFWAVAIGAAAPRRRGAAIQFTRREDPSMTALRMRARDFLSEDELVAVRERSTWKGVALIVHAWVLIVAAIALVAWWPNPLTFLLAVGIIGSRQLGLAILMHDGAHGCLSADEKTNLTLSQWFCAYPVFAETRAYRRYHLQHHARTQQDDDPDLILSAPFPITKMSYRRKFLRDITGQTGYQQRKAQLLNALGPSEWPLAQRAAHFREKLGPQFAVNAVMFAGLVAAGVWWAYPLLWLLPLFTWQMVITRIRNIAEHAVVPDSADPLRNTRTTHAGFLERLFIAPYYVNYHLEHHLLFYVPCYNLPRVHRILSASRHAARMEVQPNYAAVLRLATAKPNHEDRPGQLVSNARRARAGAEVGGDQKAGGF